MPGGYHNQARMGLSSAAGLGGTFSLGAAIAPYQTFIGAGVITNETVPYSAVDGSANCEMGWGVFSSAANTLTRNVFTSTNGGSAINASSATQVFITPSLIDYVQLSLTAHANLGGL